MIGGGDDVGGVEQAEIGQRLADAGEIVIGVLIPASEVGPLMPGTSVFRLSP